MKAVKISKVQIEIGDKILVLSLEEARELRKILNETFPEKSIPLPPYQPIVIERNPPYPCRPIYWSMGYSNGTLGISSKGGTST